MEATNKKIGRPTESKKDFVLRTRLDEEILKKLNTVAKIKNISKSEVVRHGIEIQYETIKNKK